MEWKKTGEPSGERGGTTFSPGKLYRDEKTRCASGKTRSREGISQRKGDVLREKPEAERGLAPS